MGVREWRGRFFLPHRPAAGPGWAPWAPGSYFTCLALSSPCGQARP